MLFAFGLASTICLVLSDLELRWKILAVALFGLGLAVTMLSSRDDSTLMILSVIIYGVLALWGVIHSQR
jgi:hypothetical protein